MGDEMFRQPVGVHINSGVERRRVSHQPPKSSTKSSHGRHSSRQTEIESTANGTVSTDDLLNQSCTEALLASVFDQVSPVTPGHTARSRYNQGHAAGSRSRAGPAQSTPAASVANEYLAYSSDEEYEAFMMKPRTDYTYARSVSYNAVSPQRVGPPSMSRHGLHAQSGAGDSPAAAAGYSRLSATGGDAGCETVTHQVYSYRREISTLETSAAAAAGVGHHSIWPGLDEDSADEAIVSARHLSNHAATNGRLVHSSSAKSSSTSRVLNSLSTALLWPLMQVSSILIASYQYALSPFEVKHSSIESQRYLESKHTNANLDHREKNIYPTWKKTSTKTSDEESGRVKTSTDYVDYGQESRDASTSGVSSASQHRYGLRSTPQRLALRERHFRGITMSPGVGDTDVDGHSLKNNTHLHGTERHAEKSLLRYISPVWLTVTALSFLSQGAAAAGQRLNPAYWVPTSKQRVSSPQTTPGWLRSAGVLLTGSASAASADALQSARVLPAMDQPEASRGNSVRTARDTTLGRKRGLEAGDGTVPRTSAIAGSGVSRSRWCYWLPLLVLVILLLPLFALLLWGGSPSDGESARTAALQSAVVSWLGSAGRPLYSLAVAAAAAVCCLLQLLATLATSALGCVASITSALTALVLSASWIALETLYGLLLTLCGSVAHFGTSLAGGIAAIGGAASDVTVMWSEAANDVIGWLADGVMSVGAAVMSAVASILTLLGATAMFIAQLIYTPLATIFTSEPGPVPAVQEVPPVPVQLPLNDVYTQLSQLRSQLDMLQAQQKNCQTAWDPAAIRAALGMSASASPVSSAQYAAARRRMTSHLAQLGARMTSHINTNELATPRLLERLQLLTEADRQQEQRSSQLHQQLLQLDAEVQQLRKTLGVLQESLREARTCCKNRSSEADWSSALHVRLQNVSNLLDQRVRTYTAALKQDLLSSAVPTGVSADVAVSHQEALLIAQTQLALYDADKTGKFDFALETAGGSIISTQCTEAYTQHLGQYSLFGVPLWYTSSNPRHIIQPSTRPGQCYAFRGEGSFVIGLSRPMVPTEFVVEHVARELTPGGTIDSAPRHFSVMGMADSKDVAGTFLLGSYEYNAQTGPPLQQFVVSTPDVSPISAVQLRIHSNWGHPEYTCLYRFRVHGNIASNGLRQNEP